MISSSADWKKGLSGEVVILVGEGKKVSGVLSLPDGPVKKGLILARGEFYD